MKKQAKPHVQTVSSDQERVVNNVPADSDPLGAEQILYRTFVDSLTDYAVFAVSPVGIVISWNAGATTTFGYTEAEIVGKPFSIIFTPEDAKSGAPEKELATALSDEQTQHDRWHVRKDGSRFWGTNTVHPLHNESGKLLGFTKLVRDTTASHIAVEKLSDSEQQLRLLIESVRDYAIFSMALDGAVSSWNSGAEKVFGYAQDDIVGQNFSTLFSADDIRAGVPLAELRKATVNGFVNVERWLVRKDGSRFLSSGKISKLKVDAAGELRGFVKIAHDITEYHAAAEDLRRQAQYDELTELPNRRNFYEHLQRAIALMKRRPANVFAVLFIDVDHFKAINDEFGHIAADQLLTMTARRLESCVRSEDIVARIGGDEFAILVNGINSVTDANDAADRIEAEMRKPILIEGYTIHATMSVGIAMADKKYHQPEDILRDADSAMYSAKTAGRARSMVYGPSTPSAGGEDIAAELQHALERDGLRIVYQPIIRLSDLTVAGFESLVRWQHPRRGLLRPTDFIPQAETSEAILGIDKWMLNKACSQLVQWQKDGPADKSLMQISVNVSSRAFAHDEFLSDLRDILTSTGLAPARLRLEITESAILERSDRVVTLLEAIRRMGVELDFDDFGTGFSSLGALQHLSVDALKIDSTFVASMSSNKGARLVETVLILAHKLEIATIAEGIETDEQLRRLTELGCDFGQGFLFSPPLDAAAAGTFSLSPVPA